MSLKNNHYEKALRILGWSEANPEGMTQTKFQLLQSEVQTLALLEIAKQLGAKREEDEAYSGSNMDGRPGGAEG
jgi:hypothetical protein